MAKSSVFGQQWVLNCIGFWLIWWSEQINTTKLSWWKIMHCMRFLKLIMKIRAPLFSPACKLKANKFCVNISFKILEVFQGNINIFFINIFIRVYSPPPFLFFSGILQELKNSWKYWVREKLSPDIVGDHHADMFTINFTTFLKLYQQLVS